MSETWNAGRIAELRRSADEVHDPEYDPILTTSGVLSLLDALESARDAFEDVMGALAKALDGDDSYAERPAELAWRLRDQRDEALARVSSLEGEMETYINESEL